MATAAANRTQLTYEGVVYDVKTTPAGTSKLVLDKKAEVLSGVRLDKLVHNLAITGDLIHLAYNATPRRYGDLRANIDALHIRFGDLCGKCVTALGEIKSASEEVSRKLGVAFGLLYQGKEEVAITMLSRCADQAAKLAESAGQLADRFDQLCTLADKALADSEVKQGDEIRARDELKQTKDNLVAKQANLKELQEKLATLVASLKTEYDEAKGTLSTTEQRAFALAITGAIMQPLGQALGGAATAVALVYSSRGVPPGAANLPGAAPPAPPAPTQPGATPPAPPAPETRPPSPENQRKFDEAKAKLEAAKLDAAACEEDAKTLTATIEVTKKRLETLAQRQTDPGERRKAEATLNSTIAKTQRDLDTATSEKERANKDVVTRTQEFEAAKKLIESLGVAISNAGQNLSSMGNDYIKIAESQRERVRELFKVMIEKQDAERAILGEVKEVALRLENISAKVDSAEVTISALFQVIAAMKQVTAILHEARLFWSNMRDACQVLSKPAFQEEMRRNMADFPTEDRVALFYDNEGFKLGLLNYLAKWRALEVIAAEYIEATIGVREKVVEDFKIALHDDAAKAKVLELSTRLLGEVASDIGKLDAERGAVEQALKAA